jgi:DNA-binding transcriptional MerR regulator/methylmalonyl-CoA mutase cobalamin-binding subunit
MLSEMPEYRIKTACKLTGVPRNTLLSWERRYGFVKPTRAANGYRLYSELDIQLIRRVKDQVDQGWAISEAIAHVLMRRQIELHGESQSLVSREDLLQALLSFDRGRAQDIIQKIVKMPINEQITNFLSPVLYQIGEGWASGVYSIAQEHFATGIVRDYLSSILSKLGSGSEDAAVVACCGYPGDHHELGLLMLAVRLVNTSRRVTWLGANMPEASLIQFLIDHPPAMVCVSVTLKREAEVVEAFARRVRAAIPNSIEIVIGGLGVVNVKPVEGVRFVRDSLFI